jgi:hypothetical protein
MIPRLYSLRAPAAFVVAGAVALLAIVAGAQTTQTYHGLGVTSFTCRVTAATVTTECRAAPAAGLKAYVSDVVVTNNVATAQTLKVVTGTGTNCATGAADLTHAFQFGAAVGNFGQTWNTALSETATARAVCVTPSAATSFSATITGFVGP